MKAMTTKKTISFMLGILFSVLFAITLASCGQIAENSDEQMVTINLPNLSNGSSRSISRDDIGRLHGDTRKYRVIFQTSGGTTVVREGTGGTFSASFATGVEISVTVECLNASDEVIVRTVAKTLKVGAGENSLSFNLSQDGTEVIPPTPEPEPEPQPEPGKVTYADGGSNVSNMPSDTASYNKNEDVTLETTEPTRPGYDFSGWTATIWLSATDINGGETTIPQGIPFASVNTQISGIDTKITKFKMPAGGVVLTATWKPKTYNLELNPNHSDGGIPQPAELQSDVTVESTQALQILTRAGYTFAGYTVSQSPQPNDTKYTTIAQLQADIRNGVIGTSGNTIDLYAQWTPTSYNINYVLDGGQNGSDAKPSYTIADQTFNLPTPTKADSLFMGWYEDGSFSGSSVTEIPQGSTVDKTFYAKWAYDIKMVSITGGTVPLTAAYQPTVSNFRISDAEITQAQWYDVVGNNGYGTEPSEGDDYPMHYVNWFDAIVFCNKLSIREGKEPCYTLLFSGSDPDSWGSPPDQSDSTTWAIECDWDADGYRLPTEAEWEYAARAGNTATTGSVYGNGQGGTTVGVNNIGDYAWHSGNANGKTHPVKEKSPNGYGLYDMSGNVMEWCWDYYGEPYDTQEDIDPSGTTTPNGNRLCRGGSYLDDTSRCIVGSGTDSRDGRATALARYQQAGFRVVCRP